MFRVEGTFLGQPIETQFPLSNQASTAGFAFVEVDRSSIRFIGADGGMMMYWGAGARPPMMPSADGQPGEEDADFGFQFPLGEFGQNGYAAVRNFTYDIASATLPLTPTSSFQHWDFTNGYTMSVLTGDVDYRAGDSVFGRASLAGLTTIDHGSGGVVFWTGAEPHQISINYNFEWNASILSPNDTQLHVTGGIALRFPEVVPEPRTGLIGAVFMVVAALRRRR
jgi:hypothetical protein